MKGAEKCWVSKPQLSKLRLWKAKDRELITLLGKRLSEEKTEWLTEYSVSRAGGFESPLIDSEVGTDTNTDKNFSVHSYEMQE